MFGLRTAALSGDEAIQQSCRDQPDHPGNIGVRECARDGAGIKAARYERQFEQNAADIDSDRRQIPASVAAAGIRERVQVIVRPIDEEIIDDADSAPWRDEREEKDQK
ncbi:conserved hypothetical protein [Ricinus communis]|uniref:Uncharacterized protein n=1 Tax=Ricinus communis TaxID=3988 RepID=B9TLW4_RICCO|nr:conserved hypothetical protein [Ricinus communis]